ncbi:Metallo-dependent phosphatase-like protein [Pilobolus umbonatus]|nr:Metallo-dependent phosphatase-like protein [Pilobolus umbonatus]
MKLSWSSIGCLFFTVIAIGRGWHLHKQSTKDLYEANTKDLWYTKHDMLKDEHLPRNPPPNTLWGSKANNIFYFVQLSDLHISKYRGKGHTIHFLHFLQSLLPTIKPEFVVVTGDLVDAKDISHTISEQVKEEWQVYKSAVVESKGETPWYDMRGNHDCFDMASWESSNNLYKDYGMSSASLVDGKGVYKWVISKEYGNYSFVAADSCPKKGPARPFNFFGYLTTNAMDRLVDEIIPFSYNHTFLFSHYPTTTLVPGISSDGYTFNDLRLGDHLKSYNAQSDSLELEVSDMKDHGSYRIVAIDHDLVSFVDIDLPIHEIPEVDQRDLVPLYENNTIKWPHQLDSPPVILITNPKDTKFALPTKEPLQRIGKSTHIRFLIFSKYKPEDLKVEILIDNYRHPFAAEFVGDISQENYLPLWVSAWDPNDFNDLETHTVQVNVHALNNKIGSSSILFRTDDIRTKIQGGIGEWLIESSISLMVGYPRANSFSLPNDLNRSRI